MTNTFVASLFRVFNFEGGYSNDAFDAGGETVFGLTKKYDKLVRFDLVEKYKNLTKDRKEFGELYDLLKNDNDFLKSVIDVYYKNYWVPIRAEAIISDDIVFNIFDFSVNAGVFQAVKTAQKILEVKPDGIVGTQTLDALNTVNSIEFIKKYKQARIDFYNFLVEKNEKQRKFLAGWTKRVELC